MGLIDKLFLVFLILIVILVIVDWKVENTVQTRDKGWDRNDFNKKYEEIEINRFCDINENCTHDMVCIDNRCRCPPNHRWDVLNRECRSYDCKSNKTQCQVSDPHRDCHPVSFSSISSLFRGQCECNRGYVEDKRNLKCRKFCFNNKDCDPGLSINGLALNNMVCVDFLCQCRPNFRWNITTKICEPFNCSFDAECWTGSDENRECFNGQCVCNFQEDQDSTKCYLSVYSLFRPRNYKTRKERLLLLSIFIMPSVLLYCLFSQMKKRKSQKVIAKQLIESKQTPNYIYFTKTQDMKTSIV